MSVSKFCLEYQIPPVAVRYPVLTPALDNFLSTATTRSAHPFPDIDLKTSYPGLTPTTVGDIGELRITVDLLTKGYGCLNVFA